MSANELLISSILRILTPEEINELTTTFDGASKTSLTDMISEKIEFDSHTSDAEGAKILPFAPRADVEEQNDKEQSVEMVSGPKVMMLLESLSEWTKQAIKNPFGENRKKRIARKSKETSSFIIEEKKKFEKTYTSLKSREVIGLYEKNSHVDIEQQRTNKDDLTKSGQTGILVNKKQA